MPSANVPAISTGPDMLGLYLNRAHLAFRALLEREFQASGLDRYFKPGMGNLMFALYTEDDRTKTELARELKLSKMTITRLIAELETHGLAETATDPQDRRALRVKLTPLARSLEKDYRRMARRVEKRIARCFSERQHVELSRSLKRLVTDLEGDESIGSSTALAR